MTSPIKKRPRREYGSTSPISLEKRPLRIALEGNIAAGKSTFIELLGQEKSEWSIIPEPVAKWCNVNSNLDSGDELTVSQQNGGNLLQMFYDDPSRWAYTFQSYALFSRMRLHCRPVDAKSRNSVQFFERSQYSDRYIFAENCFERGYMMETEWNIYKEWFDYLVSSMGDCHLDGIIYLRATPDVCFGRRKTRGRPEESGLMLDYLESLHDKHERLFYDKDLYVNAAFDQTPILVIDCNEEFVQCKERQQAMIEQVKRFVSGKMNRQCPSPTSSFNDSAVGSLNSTGNSEHSSGSGSDIEY